MTDRTDSLTVLLADTMRVDDIEHVVEAIRMIKGVSDVRIELSQPLDVELAKSRLRLELWETFRKALLP